VETLLRRCAKVREPIELSFGVVSGVSLVTRVLDGGGDAAFPKLLWDFLFSTGATQHHYAYRRAYRNTMLES